MEGHAIKRDLEDQSCYLIRIGIIGSQRLFLTLNVFTTIIAGECLCAGEMVFGDITQEAFWQSESVLNCSKSFFAKADLRNFSRGINITRSYPDMILFSSVAT